MADNPIKSPAEIDDFRLGLQKELDHLEKSNGILSGVYAKGQQVLDAPMHTTAMAKVLDYSMAHAYGRSIPAKVSIFEGFERERLRWVSVPKNLEKGSPA